MNQEIIQETAMAKSQHQFQKDYKQKIVTYNIGMTALNIAIIAIFTMLILSFIIRIYVATGNGMDPSIKDGDIIISNRIAYTIRDPARGDVVSTDDGKIYRIVGMPGDVMMLYGGHVFINGMYAQEPYLPIDELTYPYDAASMATYVVPEGAYYVLYDNRECYDDSRSGKAITKKQIVSKVIFVL